MDSFPLFPVNYAQYKPDELPTEISTEPCNLVAWEDEGETIIKLYPQSTYSVGISGGSLYVSLSYPLTDKGQKESSS